MSLAPQAYWRNYNYFWISFAFAIVSSLINLAFYIITFKMLALYEARKYVNLMWIKALTWLLVSFSFVNQTNWRYVFAMVSIIVGIVLVCVCAYCILKFARYDPMLNDISYAELCRARVDHDWEEQLSLKPLNDYAETTTIRRRCAGNGQGEHSWTGGSC